MQVIQQSAPLIQYIDIPYFHCLSVLYHEWKNHTINRASVMFELTCYCCLGIGFSYKQSHLNPLCMRKSNQFFNLFYFKLHTCATGFLFLHIHVIKKKKKQVQKVQKVVGQLMNNNTITWFTSFSESCYFHRAV